ncbi:MAG: RNA polymerase sigma factor [Planctomycetota bacterium]|nr:MAG: RNA polymerase sigma factor [Planctomycetota bacterium]
MAEAPDPGDGDLLDRFRSGEVAAFDLLVDRYQAPLLRYAHATLHDPAAAEDVVQETFVRLIRHAPDPGSNGAVGAWLFRVCRNLAYDTMKTETRERKRREAAGAADTASSAAPPENNELGALVSRELERLPAKQREVVRMKVVQGLSYQEIAGATGLRPGYIGWLVHTGLNTLTDRLRAAGALA